MRGKLFALIAASAVAFTVVCLPLATPISASSCDDITFIFARGSGQSLNDEDYLVYKASIKAELLRQKSNLTVGFYELGSSSQGGAKYPAVNLDFFTILGSKISSGTAFTFGKSVKEGIAELKNYTEATSETCPHTKYVIAGYSQGAMVITKGLEQLNQDNFIYTATFGDPKLYLPEGKGVIPPACLGKSLSSYRIYAPNCRTYSGSLNGKNPYLDSAWKGKVGLWCKDKDLVCGAGFKLGKAKSYNNFLEQIIQSALSSHTRYSLDGIYYSAAKTIVANIRHTFPKAFLDPSTNSLSNNRDTVFLIDSTGSMESYIEDYSNEAINLAKKTLDTGGRVALYIYGDLEERKATRLVDFGADLNEFTKAARSIEVDGGGDEPESLYSAILDILDTQNWRAGATKSIVVLTDAPALSPDRDGTTAKKVTTRTLEIDPVNVYIITEDEDVADSYEAFVNTTGGQVFREINTYSSNYIFTRPSVEFPLSDYYGKPSDIFTFSAIVTGDIKTYEWDLDFDGIFETTSEGPIITKEFRTDTSGFIQLRVTNANGISSTASASITVSSEDSPIPTINNLHVIQKGQSVHLSYDFGENTAAILVSLDEAALGLTGQNSLEITDLEQDTILTLTPISFDGSFGNPIFGKLLAPDNSSPLTPKTGRL